MKTLLLAGIALLAVHSTAHAQLHVVDLVADLGISKETVETVKNGITQVQQLTTEVQQLQTYLYMAENLIHNPVAGTLQLANMVGLTSALPVNPYAVMSLTSGYGGMNSLDGLLGKASQLGSLVSTSYSNDSLYQCADDSFACKQSQARASANAGTKGIGAQMISDLQARIPVLQGLQARLASASSPKDVQDIQAQIDVQKTDIANFSAQISATQMLNQAQQQVSSEQRVQKINGDAANLFAAMPNG